MSDLAEKTTTQILAPDGSVASLPTVLLSDEDARLLRTYKKFLQKHGLREALYCNQCWSGEREDGCKAFVTTNQVLIQCRCRMRFHQGMTF